MQMARLILLVICLPVWINSLDPICHRAVVFVYAEFHQPQPFARKAASIYHNRDLFSLIAFHRQCLTCCDVTMNRMFCMGRHRSVDRLVEMQPTITMTIYLKFKFRHFLLDIQVFPLKFSVQNFQVQFKLTFFRNRSI